MGNRFTEYIGSIWQQVSLFIKILIVVVILFVLLQVTEVTSLYINVNSGGLETTSGIIFLWSFWGSMGFFLLLFILIPICFIISLIKIYEPINGLLTVIATAAVIISVKGRFYLRDKVKCEPEPDTTRCVGHNLARSEALRKFGLKLNLSKNDKDLVFTQNWPEQFLEPNLIGYMQALVGGKFVLNVNLLNKKPSQIPDNIVVVFESNIPYDKDYKNNIGGPDDVSTWWHYGRGSLIVFGDGRVEFIKIGDFNNLRWQP